MRQHSLVPLALVTLIACMAAVRAGDLEQELGRGETRVRSAPHSIVPGRTVAQSALVERLERLRYERIRKRPEQPGQFFYGHEVFWIYRRAYRWSGRDHAAELVGLDLRREDGMILGGVTGKSFALEPELLAESLAADRADRTRIELDDLPQHVWESLLAAEDARFFDHAGVDAKSVARAALANLKGGKISQGGSTITQQLIKNRDLTPKRSMGRKLSEAVRALWLEAEYDKREILQAYLNQVYYGHVDGLAVHGIGTAARVYFSKPAGELDLAESALLAGIIQGPNRLSPIQHPERAVERRNWVLTRLIDLGWADVGPAVRARNAALKLRRSAPKRAAPVHFLSWVLRVAQDEAAKRLDKQRGVVVETTLDPYLQELAEQSVRRHLKRLRQEHRRLRGARLSAALVAVDVETGGVVAYVGGDPASTGDSYDRARKALRQPGSTVKPLVLLEALEDCGSRNPLHMVSRVADEPLRLDLPSGPWEPKNYDGRHRGIVDVRTVLADSLNVPTVRIARWCGFEQTAQTLERAGLALPRELPPSFVLGAVETTPLQLAQAYTVLATPGDAMRAHPVQRIEKPEGRSLARFGKRKKRVVRPATAYLVRELLRSAVERGTARVAKIDGLDVAAKTGSSSELRDSWLAGHAGSLVTVVWVGLDGGDSLGLTGAAAAGPLWREFMEAAVPARPDRRMQRPRGVVERQIDPQTGLLVREFNRRSRRELFRVDVLPPRDRFWRVDRAVPVVR